MMCRLLLAAGLTTWKSSDLQIAWVEQWKIGVCSGDPKEMSDLRQGRSYPYDFLEN